MAYRTTPDPNRKGMPPGIAHIIGNEAAERFSFYGMRGILVVFMSQYLHLLGAYAGEAMPKTEAIENFHIFVAAVYFTPFLGGLLADAFFGKYRVIIWLSVVYCMGHASLAFMGFLGSAGWMLFLGLLLITVGSGGIKPCVSAHVGDQFGKSNSHLITKIFNYFYFSINLGAFISMLLTPWLLEWWGPHLAFGVPGVLMALATIVFWMGRNRFVHVPAGGKKFLRETFSAAGLKASGKLVILFAFVAVFWSLFDQTGSSWIFQAQDMDRNMLGREWLPSQIQSINSIFVLAFIPLFTFLVYPAISKVWKLTPLRKIGIGMGLMVVCFALTGYLQGRIEAGERPNISWQVLAYALLTAAEIMVSIVGLEFAYTQAPKTMKSMIMSLYLFAVFAGNAFTAVVNRIIRVPEIEFTQGQHPGFDGKTGTDDDLAVDEGSDTLTSPAHESLQLAFTTLEALTVDNGDKFPTQEAAETGIGKIIDPWGNPLRYSLLNSSTARISSDGPDAIAKTQWDLGLNITYTSGVEDEHPDSWLAKRKHELGLTPTEAPDGVEPALLSAEYYAGGGTKLEGSAYFSFFTWLMLGTTVLFIPYAYFYKGETILQD